MRRVLAGLCSAVLFAAVALPADAQNVSVGLKAGPNFTTIGGADAEEANSYARIVGGGFMVIELGSNIAFQPELLYAQKGAKLIDSPATAKLKIDYFEVPLLLRLQPALGVSRFLPHALAGPTIAYKSSCDIAVESGSTNASVGCDEGEFALPIKDVDFGVAFGAGVDMAVGRGFVGVEARYEFGLVKIDDTNDPSDVKNRALSIMAGFRIPLGNPQSASRKY